MSAATPAPRWAVIALARGAAFAGEIPRAERRSGYEFMSRETRAMQDDDTANPGMLWVLDGEALWNRKTGAAGRACADCHGDARASMKGVAARYPAFDAARGRPVNLEQRINLCRTDRQQAPPLAWESRELLALTAYVARQSRGLPIDVAIDARTQPFLDAGRATFHRRQGQLNLSCASATTTTGAGSSPATSSRRRIRPATRSTGWSGRASARCSGGCATASSGCARSRTSTAPPSSSTSSLPDVARARDDDRGARRAALSAPGPLRDQSLRRARDYVVTPWVSVSMVFLNLGSSCSRVWILSTACSTVVWSLPPKTRPISASEAR